MSSRQWPRGRKDPYTNRGINRVACIRCGYRAEFQWSACADNNKWRGICRLCDVALNLLVLTWLGDPEAEKKVQDYVVRLPMQPVSDSAQIPAIDLVLQAGKEVSKLQLSPLLCRQTSNDASAVLL